MNLRDMIEVSFGNLRRMKLRTFLTSAGILIAIAAFVSMLSFGAGNQRYVEKQFDQLGLLTTIQVYPRNSGERPDTGKAPPLTDEALRKIGAIRGVNLVYPYDAFVVNVRCGDSVFDAKAQALSGAALDTRLFSRLAAGRGFVSTRARETLVSEDLLKKTGIASADSLIGRRLIVSVRVSTIDSGIAHLFYDRGESLLDRAKRIRIDSLRKSAYRSQIIRREGNELLRRFVSGFLNAREEIAETLTVCGVRSSTNRMGRLRVEPLIIPVETAARFRAAGISGNPTDLFAAMTQGTLFSDPAAPGGNAYPQVTVDFDPKVFYKSITDSIQAMGYRTFSFAQNFEEIQRAFMYFDLALALIGLIALTTASLGIINTMVMSITERRREIGILKSLGADDRHIKVLFLTESGAIGFIGTTAGILFGWLIARVASFIARSLMAREGITPVDLFALPYWLVLISLAVGVTVSIVAGYYPARRAARVDPVEALRNE